MSSYKEKMLARGRWIGRVNYHVGALYTMLEHEMEVAFGHFDRQEAEYWSAALKMYRDELNEKIRAWYGPKTRKRR